MSWLANLRNLTIEPVKVGRHEKWLSTLACLTAILLTTTLKHYTTSCNATSSASITLLKSNPRGS